MSRVWRTAMYGAGRALRLIVLAPIAVYQRVISPGLPRRCKYEPTCSRYAVEAVNEYGILRGLVLAVWRLARCNPWSHGGFDPVRAQRVFKAPPRRAATARSTHVTHEPAEPTTRPT